MLYWSLVVAEGAVIQVVVLVLVDCFGKLV
jgi:hypothetical protein